MGKLKTALVGCGKVGHFHAKAFVNLAQSQFTAVCDYNLERAQDFAKQYGVKAYDNVEQMVANEGIEMLSVCTPHPIHASVAIAVSKIGCHVLIEKPLASNLADCRSILAAAKEGNAKIGTVCQRRFYRPCLRIKKAIDEGKIGRPIIGTVTMLGWRDKAYYESDPWRGTWQGEGGGVLVNQAPHQLDLLLWYMGEVEEVYGVWRNLNHPYIEVEDTAVAIIKFKNGGIGNVLVSNSQNPALFGKVHVHGDNGASVGVQTDGGAMFIAGVSSITEPPYNDLWTVTGEQEQLDIWKKEDCDFFNSVDSMYYYHQLQIEDFLNSVIHNTPPLIDGNAGLKTVELIEAIYRSTHDNKVIKFPLD